MIRTLLLVAAAAPTICLAQSRMLETTDEARQRHNAERYGTYRDSGGQPPLGGYRERLGDPAPRGTESPGYNTRPDFGRERNDSRGFSREDDRLNTRRR